MVIEFRHNQIFSSHITLFLSFKFELFISWRREVTCTCFLECENSVTLNVLNVNKKNVYVLFILSRYINYKEHELLRLLADWTRCHLFLISSIASFVINKSVKKQSIDYDRPLGRKNANWKKLANLSF